MSQAKRMRRVELIDKKYKSVLTDEESAELAELTAWTRANMGSRSPMPKVTTPTPTAKRKRRAKGVAIGPIPIDNHGFDHLVKPTAPVPWVVVEPTGDAT